MFTPNLIYSTKLQPHTQQFLLSLDVDTQNQEYGFIDDATVLPDLKGSQGKRWGRPHPVAVFATQQPAP